MPDNWSIEIYRKGSEKPIQSLVRSVGTIDRAQNGMPHRIAFRNEDDRDGTIFVNTAEVETVIITPVGTSDKD